MEAHTTAENARTQILKMAEKNHFTSDHIVLVNFTVVLTHDMGAFT